MIVRVRSDPMAYAFPTDPTAIWKPVDIIALACSPGCMSPEDWRPVDWCAVVLAESGGNPLAQGRVINAPTLPIHLSVALGMFQLLSFYNVDQAPYPDMPRLKVSDCFDPMKAWPQAWGLMNKNRTGWHYNWTNWSGYTSGLYDRNIASALAGMKAYRVSQSLPPGVFG